LYSPLKLAFKYLRYLTTASNGRGHGIHSPFIYAFTKEVLNGKFHSSHWKQLERLRTNLKKDQRVLQVNDLGAGSGKLHHHQRSVSSIANTSLKSQKYASLLGRIVQYYNCEYILELGTSLGITSAYIATTHPKVHLTTLEGVPDIAAVAHSLFDQLGLYNIELVQGNFDQTLSGAILKMPRVDLVYIDGNHRKIPTLQYFESVLHYANDETIFVFDDIHWSSEMEDAWEAIRMHPKVTSSIDLFFLGLIFIRPAFKEPVHTTIRF
jgi:predicted O-methyltransferase YrrM